MALAIMSPIPRQSASAGKSDSGERIAIAFALVFPTLMTWLYFVGLADSPAFLQQIAYAAGKTIQFGFPLFWVLRVRSEVWNGRRQRSGTLRAGVGLGLATAAATVILYEVWLRPAGFFAGPDAQIRAKLAGLALDTAWGYAAIGFFYVFGHSFAEEYYWRWFVFRRLRKRASLLPALAASSLGFAAHHVVLLASYFGWDSPATYLFSLAVAVGGALWAWLYERGGSLVSPWVSHLLIDAGIFLVGYDIVRHFLR